MKSVLYQQRAAQKQLYLDPRTKLCLSLVTSYIMLSGKHGQLGIILHCVLTILPFLLLIMIHKYKKAFSYGILYFVCSFLPNLIFPYLPYIVNLLFTGVIAISTTILPSGMMIYVVLTTTTVSEFMAAMDRMHVKRCISAPISIIFRFFPTIMEEYHAVHDAMVLRSIDVIHSPLKMLEYRLVPLITSIVSIGNDLSASALTRGLDAPYERTNVCPIGFIWHDVITFLFLVLCIILFVLSMIIC